MGGCLDPAFKAYSAYLALCPQSAPPLSPEGSFLSVPLSFCPCGPATAPGSGFRWVELRERKKEEWNRAREREITSAGGKLLGVVEWEQRNRLEIFVYISIRATNFRNQSAFTLHFPHLPPSLPWNSGAERLSWVCCACLSGIRPAGWIPVWTSPLWRCPPCVPGEAQPAGAVAAEIPEESSSCRCCRCSNYARQRRTTTAYLSGKLRPPGGPAPSQNLQETNVTSVVSVLTVLAHFTSPHYIHAVFFQYDEFQSHIDVIQLFNIVFIQVVSKFVKMYLFNFFKAFLRTAK